MGGNILDFFKAAFPWLAIGILVAIYFGVNARREKGFLLALIGDFVFISSVICMRDSWRVGIPEEQSEKEILDEIRYIPMEMMKGVVKYG